MTTATAPQKIYRIPDTLKSISRALRHEPIIQMRAGYQLALSPDVITHDVRCLTARVDCTLHYPQLGITEIHTSFYAPTRDGNAPFGIEDLEVPDESRLAMIAGMAHAIQYFREQQQSVSLLDHDGSPVELNIELILLEAARAKLAPQQYKSHVWVQKKV